MAVQSLSHVGICVSELERSRRFYTQVLGFRPCGALEVAGPPADRLLGLAGVKLRAVYLERDGTRIELLDYAVPGTEGARCPRPMNALGLTHLSLRVDGLDALCQAIAGAGGRVLTETRIEVPATRTRAVFATDPDGTRIELVEAPGDLPGLEGAPRELQGEGSGQSDGG